MLCAREQDLDGFQEFLELYIERRIRSWTAFATTFGFNVEYSTAVRRNVEEPFYLCGYFAREIDQSLCRCAIFEI